MAQFDTWEKNQHKKGFGLVKLIVVAALFSFIMLTLAAFMVNLQGSANNVKFRADGDTLNDEIRALLSSPVACRNNFAGLLPQAGVNHSRTVLYNGATPAQTVYATGQTYGDQGSLLAAKGLSKIIYTTTCPSYKRR